MRTTLRTTAGMGALCAAMVLGTPDRSLGQVVVPVGGDCWTTPACDSDYGAGTKVNFCNYPIPFDAFCAGSEPFDGEILLGGRPGVDFDTVVSRLEEMVFQDELPSVASTPVRITELDLVSCDSIVVIIDGESSTWEVAVGLSTEEPPPGLLRATKTHENGGQFNAAFYVQARLTFTRAGGPAIPCPIGTQVVFDTGQEAFLPDLMTTGGNAHWVHQLDTGGPTLSCGVNFTPGVEEDPGRVAQCCRRICHSGATATHCNIVGYDCSDCDDGACCDPNDGSCLVVAPNLPDESAKQVCENGGGEYKGDTTTCDDSDGDGIPDVQEINDCCAPADDPCNIRSDPTKADTDGDGWNDGHEIANGTDPCVVDKIPTVSEWGLIAMALLTVLAGAVVVARRRATAVDATGGDA